MYQLIQNKSVSIVVPFYGERNLQEKLAKLEQEIKPYFSNYEIILVFDGSKERTINEGRSLKTKNIKIFYYEKNRGKGFALKYGAFKASGEYIIFLDGGMELHPGDIKRFCLLMDAYEADIVIGSKRHQYSKVECPWYRKIFSFGCQLLIRVALRLKSVKDSQVGLKLFKREVLEKVFPKTTCKGYAIDLEILSLANKFKFQKILEAPISLTFSETAEQGTLVEIFRLIKISLRVSRDIFKLAYRLNLSKFYENISYEHWQIPKELRDLQPIYQDQTIKLNNENHHHRGVRIHRNKPMQETPATKS